MVKTPNQAHEHKKPGVCGHRSVTVIALTLLIVTAPQPNTKSVDETVWPVSTIVATPANHASELTLYGKVETPRKTSLTAAVAAHVATVFVVDGDTVEQGTVLVQLDDTEAKLKVTQRRADLNEAQANLASLNLLLAENQANLVHEKRLLDLATRKARRHEKLQSQNSISEDTLNNVLSEESRQAISMARINRIVDDAENQRARATATVNRALALLELAQVDLDRTKLVAPYPGRVNRVHVAPGALVRPGSALVDMYDNQKLEIRVALPTKIMSEVRASLNKPNTNLPEITATLSNNRAKKSAGMTYLNRLSAEVAPGSSSVDGFFTLPEQSDIELGASVTLVVRLPPKQNTVAVPVQSMYGHNRIFVVVNNRLQGLDVERVGELQDSHGRLNVLVRAMSLKEGTEIVTSQLSNAITGLKVQPTTARLAER